MNQFLASLFAGLLALVTFSQASRASEFADPRLNQLARVLPGSDFGQRGPIISSCYAKLQRNPKQTPSYLSIKVISLPDSESLIGAIVSESSGGQRRSRFTTAEPEFSDIRPSLTAATDTKDETLNGGERLILHAMMVQSMLDNSDKKRLLSGLDLTQVRATRVFYIDRNPADDIGVAAVIEALDKNGKRLGSFIGGFLVLPCL